MIFFSRGLKWQTAVLVIACLALLTAIWFFYVRKPYQKEVIAALSKEEAASSRVASETAEYRELLRNEVLDESMALAFGPTARERREALETQLMQSQRELKDASNVRFELQKEQVAAQIEQDRRRDYTRIGLTFLIFPFAAYVLIAKKSSPPSRTAAASAIAALLAFWFAK